MAKRPSLNDHSFLAAVFSPKNNPLPTGLRKRKLVGVKGRSARRVNAYNAMSAVNQQILTRSGQREEYLRGNTTIADAKRALRSYAVDLGVAKPLRTPTVAATPRSGVRGQSIQSQVLNHLYDALSGATTRKPVNLMTLRKNSRLMSKAQAQRALKMTAPEIMEAGKNADEEVQIGDSVHKVNPFWYH